MVSQPYAQDNALFQFIISKSLFVCDWKTASFSAKGCESICLAGGHGPKSIKVAVALPRILLGLFKPHNLLSMWAATYVAFHWCWQVGLYNYACIFKCCWQKNSSRVVKVSTRFEHACCFPKRYCSTRMPHQSGQATLYTEHPRTVWNRCCLRKWVPSM